MDQGTAEHATSHPLIPARAEESVFERILWLSRWVELLGVAASVIVTVLIEHVLRGTDAENHLREVSGISRFDFHWILLICAVMAAWNIFAQGLERRDLLTRSSVTGLAVDLLFVMAVLQRTNGLQSPFYGLLFLVVMGAAIWAGVKGGIIAATVSTAGVITLEMLEVVHLHGTRLVDVYTRLAAPEVFSRLPYLFLVAWLTGAIADAFRRETEKRLETQRQTEQLEAERRSVEREMDAARRVQESLMPAAVPEIPGIEVAVRYEPAGAVGGDMYDFPRPAPDQLGFVLADVSGHSLPAALLVASAKGALYDTQPMPPGPRMAAINERLLLDCGDDRFVTMVYASLDLGTLRLTWVNAGHPPPLLLRDGETCPLPGNGLVLGIIPHATYRTESITLRCGDVLLFYSDGLMEREAGDGHVTGFEEFREMISRIPTATGVENIANSVLRGAGRLGAVKDDVTLIVIHVSVPPTDASPVEIALV